MSHRFLSQCQSQPLTLADLQPGAKFIFFPDDGDDSGHGGFRGGSSLKERIESYHPGGLFPKSYLYTHKDANTGNPESMPLDAYVLRVVQ